MVLVIDIDDFLAGPKLEKDDTTGLEIDAACLEALQRRDDLAKDILDRSIDMM